LQEITKARDKKMTRVFMRHSPNFSEFYYIEDFLVPFRLAREAPTPLSGRSD
jgi:hypothetical protein